MRRSAAGGRRDGGGSAPAVQSAGAGARLLHLTPGVPRGWRGRWRAGPGRAERSGPAAGSEVWRRRRLCPGRGARWGGRERGVEPAPAPRCTARLRGAREELEGGPGQNPTSGTRFWCPNWGRLWTFALCQRRRREKTEIKNENDWTRVFRAHSSSQWNRGWNSATKDKQKSWMSDSSSWRGAPHQAFLLVKRFLVKRLFVRCLSGARRFGQRQKRLPSSWVCTVVIGNCSAICACLGVEPPPWYRQLDLLCLVIWCRFFSATAGGSGTFHTGVFYFVVVFRTPWQRL